MVVPDSDSGMLLRGVGKCQANIWCWPIGSEERSHWVTASRVQREWRVGQSAKPCPVQEDLYQRTLKRRILGSSFHQPGSEDIKNVGSLTETPQSQPCSVYSSCASSKVVVLVVAGQPLPQGFPHQGRRLVCKHKVAMPKIQGRWCTKAYGMVGDILACSEAGGVVTV